MNKLTGSCLCGAVTYKTTGLVLGFNVCHCDMCQKATGGPFGPFVRIKKTDFQFLTGEDVIQTYSSSPGVTRSFCETCGSTLQWLRDDSDGLGFTAGTLDTPLDMKPTAQIFCGESQAWHQLRDDVEQFDLDPGEK